MELESDTGRMLVVAMAVAPLAALSASMLPAISDGSGIHWMKMEDKMESMEL